MEVSIKNLGPIKKGAIPLNSSLLLFVGYNNTGKSYATQLIWAIFNEQFRNRFLHQLNPNVITRVKKIENFSLTEKVILKLISEYESFIRSNIHSIFSLPKKHFQDFDISISLTKKEINEIVKYKSQELSMIDKETDEKIYIKKTGRDGKLNITGAYELINPEEIKIQIIQFYFFTIFKSAQSFFLPAIRGAYVNLFQYINKYEKEKKDMIDNYLNDDLDETRENDLFKILYESKSSYTMATNSLINKLTNLEPNQKVNKKYLHLAKKVQKLIGGEIIKKKQELINNAKFYLKFDNNELPMHISSSTTNQLAPLFLYFKYWSHTNLSDMLIMDEPEENLHPKNQIEFLKIIFDFISIEEKNKVLITTHSPLIAKMINMYVALNELAEDEKKKLSKELDIEMFDLITKENVKICFFKGNEIIDYPLSEYGAKFQDFLNVEDTLNSNFRTVTNTLFEQIEENEA